MHDFEAQLYQQDLDSRADKLIAEDAQLFFEAEFVIGEDIDDDSDLDYYEDDDFDDDDFDDDDLDDDDLDCDDYEDDDRFKSYHDDDDEDMLETAFFISEAESDAEFFEFLEAN